jgi:hypothetical protein
VRTCCLYGGGGDFIPKKVRRIADNRPVGKLDEEGGSGREGRDGTMEERERERDERKGRDNRAQSTRSLRAGI